MLWIERGGPVMWPLLLLSVVALTLIVERLLFWHRETRRPAAEVIAEAAELPPELLIDAELRRLECRMAIFDTIIAAAPMMGILGTVIGVIGAFNALSAEARPDPMAVTGGISEAVITTATGLIIALCVLFPYSYFRTKPAARPGELELAVHES